jgi:hypothetical protein
MVEQQYRQKDQLIVPAREKKHGLQLLTQEMHHSQKTSGEERMSKRKGKGKKDVTKGKKKTPAYKLQSDIESSIELKGVLEERILDAKIEFTLREALGIAKKDFHELIIDIIKRKRQMTVETVMTRAIDTRMTEDEEEEIGQVFGRLHTRVV